MAFCTQNSHSYTALPVVTGQEGVVAATEVLAARWPTLADGLGLTIAQSSALALAARRKSRQVDWGTGDVAGRNKGSQLFGRHGSEVGGINGLWTAWRNSTEADADDVRGETVRLIVGVRDVGLMRLPTATGAWADVSILASSATEVVGEVARGAIRWSRVHELRQDVVVHLVYAILGLVQYHCPLRLMI